MSGRGHHSMRVTHRSRRGLFRHIGFWMVQRCRHHPATGLPALAHSAHLVVTPRLSVEDCRKASCRTFYPLPYLNTIIAPFPRLSLFGVAGGCLIRSAFWGGSFPVESSPSATALKADDSAELESTSMLCVSVWSWIQQPGVQSCSCGRYAHRQTPGASGHPFPCRVSVGSHARPRLCGEFLISLCGKNSVSE